MESENLDVLKNFGISNNIFTYGLQGNDSNNIFLIKQEKIKKNFSDGAIVKVPNAISLYGFEKAKDDMDLYRECDQDYGIYGIENYSAGEFECKTALEHKKIRNSFMNCFNEQFDLNYGFKAFDNMITKDKEECFKSFDHEVTKLEENKKPNFCLNQKFAESNKNYFMKISEIKKENNPKFNKNNNFKNFEKTSKERTEELFNNGILKESMRNQMKQLDKLFFELNESSEAKVIIKAYKSKLKTKLYQFYQSNSLFFKEKNKFKIFHKCNFPGCSRTFASAGWLKIHFNHHLKEIKNNKFNVEFEKGLLRLKHMNLLNN